MIEKHMWRPVTSNTTVRPSSRWGHSCCVIGDELVLFGGYADSIYMNDLWIYHTVNMQWTQIKTFGTVPSQRSNSSLHFDSINNRIIMFGGGGSNKTRFNSLHFLDWNTKIWTQAKFQQNQSCPWERTYHSSQLLYPYLIVFGGEGVADLDDLWAFNLQTMKWTQLNYDKAGAKPCGRRFHSSCLIGNQFFVIAGCYSKYRPLSDIYTIDLTSFVSGGSAEGLKWKQIQLDGNSFLTRWGHASASLGNKVYIFGGRFSNDLNDILVLDLDIMKLKPLKVTPQSLPKPRRRACINFVGNCLLMFGGFNSDYFNDLHFINVTEGLAKPKRFLRNYTQIQKMINQKSTSDISILTSNGETFYCHKSILLTNFQSDQKMLQFLSKITKKQTKENLVSLMYCLYKGFGKCQIMQRYGYSNPHTEQQKQNIFIKSIQKIREKLNPTNNIFSRKNLVKVLNSNIIELTDEQFGEFLQINRENTIKDIDIVINQNYVIKSNSTILSSQSKLFKNLLSKKYKKTNEINQSKTLQITIPKGNVVLMQIILNFFLTGFLIVPQNMSCQSWIDLYELADYMSALEVKQIALYSIWSKLDDSTISYIFDFSLQYKLNDLALACSRIKLKYIQEETDKFEDKYLELAYNQNRFEIKQKLMVKQTSLLLGKKNSNISSSTVEGQKQNYQAYN